MRILFLFLFISSSIVAQSTSAIGFVYDNLTKKPIPYVNLSILESQIGTSSDIDGSYKLEFSESDLEKYIILTSLGYQDSIIPISKFINDKTIFLKAKIEQLIEVVISKKFEEEFSVVNQIKKSRISGMSMATGTNPWKIALFFPYKGEYSTTQYLRTVTIYLNSNNLFSESYPSKFRVRLFTIGENGLPSDDILTESLVVESKKNQKECLVDISPYNLTFPKEGFFIALEWLYIPFNEYIETFRTTKDKKYYELRYAPKFSFSSETIGTYKTAIFSSGKWFSMPWNGVKRGTEIIPAISLTLSN